MNLRYNKRTENSFIILFRQGLHCCMVADITLLNVLQALWLQEYTYYIMSKVNLREQ